MNETVINVLVSTAGVVLVALIGVWTARLARKSAQASANVEERAKIVEGYDKLNEDLQKRNEVLNGVVARLETRVDELEQQLRNDRRRIGDLEFEKDNHRRHFRQLLNFAVKQSDYLKEAGVRIPNQPVDLEKYIESLDD